MKTARMFFAPVVVVIAFCVVAVSGWQRAAPTSDDLFDTSTLHDIRLNMKPSDWDTLRAHFMEDTYYPADMQWRDVTVPMVGVRSRGSGSRNGVKPGLKVAFDEYVEGQKPFGLKSLVLANAVQDPSMLKQREGLLMFAKMGLPAPRVVHTRLFVNDDYVGLYELIEPIDKIFLARTYGNDADGKVENNGYLYEFAWKDGYRFEYPGRELRQYADLFEPKSHETEAPVLLYGPLEEMFRTINEVSDRRFEDEVGTYLDLALFAKHIAVDNFIAEYDGMLGYAGVDNLYLYRFQGQKKSQWMPWDKDLSYWERFYDIFEGVEANVLARRALAVPAVYRTYLETLIACAEVAMAPATPESRTGWLEEEIQHTISQIREAGLADEKKRFTDERFEDELAKVVRFARDRGPFVIKEAKHALEIAGMGGLQ